MKPSFIKASGLAFIVAGTLTACGDNKTTTIHVADAAPATPDIRTSPETGISLHEALLAHPNLYGARTTRIAEYMDLLMKDTGDEDAKIRAGVSENDIRDYFSGHIYSEYLLTAMKFAELEDLAKRNPSTLNKPVARQPDMIETREQKNRLAAGRKLLENIGAPVSDDAARGVIGQVLAMKQNIGQEAGLSADAAPEARH